MPPPPPPAEPTPGPDRDRGSLQPSVPVGNGEPVRLILEDGSVVPLPRHPELRRQIAYLARHLVPDRPPAALGPGDRVKLIFEDGSSLPLSKHAGVEAHMVSYLATNILPSDR